MMPKYSTNFQKRHIETYSLQGSELSSYLKGKAGKQSQLIGPFDSCAQAGTARGLVSMPRNHQKAAMRKLIRGVRESSSQLART